MIKQIIRDCNPGEIYLNEQNPSEDISQNMEVFKILVENYRFKLIGSNESIQMDEYYKQKIICSVYCSIVKYLSRQQNNISDRFSEQLLIKWIRILNEWIMNVKIQRQNFMQETIQKLFTIFYISSLNQTQQMIHYDSINDETSELSRQIKKLILNLQKLPNDFNSFRGIKNIIFGWGITINQQTKDIENILIKLIQNYFNINNFNQLYIDVFQTQGLSNIFKKILGKVLSLYLFIFYQKLQKENINNKNDNRIKIYSQIINKLSVIISTKVTLDSFQKVINIFHQLYIKYTHIWPALAAYRLWIVQNNQEVNDALFPYYLDQSGKQVAIFGQLMDKSLSEGAFPLDITAIYQQLQSKLYNCILCIHLKKQNQNYADEIYNKYFNILNEIKQIYKKYNIFLIQNKQKINNEIQDIINNLNEILNEIKISIRYLLINSNQLLISKQEQSIIKNIILYYQQIFRSLKEQQDWEIINYLLGFNKLKCKSILQSKQILGVNQRYIAKFHTSLEHQPFIPFSFISTLYSIIRNKYSQILQKGFTQAYHTPQNEQIWINIQSILFPGVNISGKCIFNNKPQQKSKIQMVLGIYFEQYNKLIDIITNEKQNNKIILNIFLQFQKRKILSKFYQFIKVTKLKIQQKSRINIYQNRYQNRFRFRQQQSIEEIYTNLADMGIDRQYVDLALENIQIPDQNLALEWIDNNRSAVEQQLMVRAIQRSRNANRVASVRVEQRVGDGIVQIALDKFKKQVIGDNLKRLIKMSNRLLFQNRILQQANRLKDILFLLMDNFNEDYRMKQYGNFNDKIYKDIDNIQKQQNYNIKLNILFSIMQTFSEKLIKSRILFYQKQIHIKILKLIQKMNVKEDINRAFSVLNSYLPILTPQILSQQLQSYLSYLLDLIHQYQICNKNIISMLYKIAKCNKSSLIQKITRNILSFLSLGLIKQNIISILNIIFQSDRQLALINAQLDLKTYIYQRYKHRINTFQPQKQHVLQIDIKQFSVNFNKYDKDSSIYEVSKRLLNKKKSKNRYFYYDCRKQQNLFNYSIYYNNNFINYQPQQSHKNIIKLLLSILFKNKENEEQLIIQLHKILTYYKILIPYTITIKIQDNTLLNWIINSSNISKRKFKLLLFLILNNNIFIKTQDSIYGFYSISDYVCAKIVKIISNQIKNKTSTFNHYLSTLYLQQVRKFSQFCVSPLTLFDNNNLKSILQQELFNTNGINYLIIGQILNIQYKIILLNNLRKKYKMINNNENYYQRQFLKLSSFYNELPIKQYNKIQQKKNPFIQNQPQPILQSQIDNSQQQSHRQQQQRQQRHIFQQAFIHRYGLSRGFRRQQPIQYQQIITPLPIKNIQNNISQNQSNILPLEIINHLNVHDIVVVFEQYLQYHRDIQEQLPLKKVTLDKIGKFKVPQNMAFKVILSQGTVDIDLKLKKNQVFQKHFGDILHIVDAKIVWTQKKQPVSSDKRVDQLSRRIFSNQGLNLENRHEMINHLQRLIASRQMQEQQQPQQPPRVLNITQIYNNIPELTSPIVPVIPKQPEPANQEKKEQIAQEVVAEVQVEKVPIEPVVNSEVVPPSNQELIPPNNIQGLPLNNEQVVIPPNNQNQQIKVEQQQEQSQNLQQVQNQVQANIIPLIENPIPLEVPIQPPADFVYQPPQPPARDRQILRVFGLPQTFLRDAGIDEESFDCLPEDFQQEQLMHFISQQNAQNRPNQNTGNNPNVSPPVVDQVSENIAFLASLDMQTRAQVLLQATPQFLSSLPPSIRQQAETYRNNQINRIIEQQQIQQQKKHRQKIPATIIYPKINKQQFTKIDDIIAKKFLQRIFYKYPDYKIPSIKILLENKQTQQKTIASIIAILRYYESPKNDVKIEGTQVVRQNGIIVDKKIIFNSKQIRVALLHTIYQHLKIPIYKDQQFLINFKYSGTYLPELQYVFGESQKMDEQIKIDPLSQLFTFALQIYKPLCVELIKYIKDLPQKSIQYMFQSIESGMFPREIYDNLSNFSDNIIFKKVFSQRYKQKSPKIQILASLLKYNFSHLPYLRQVHQKSLKNYSHAYIEFYNQIFRIYTLQNLQEVQSILINYKKIHYEVIKFLLQSGKDIEKEPIAILLKKPQLLDFQTKRFIFLNHPKIRKISRHRVHIEVDRAHLFQGSYNQLMSRSLRQLEGRIQVSFVNQPGYDAGGLKRQWFLVVSRQIFNQDYALFQKSSSGSTYQPNPKSYINPDHLNYFKFIGRFIGKALVERELIDAYFTRAFYKMILGQQLEFKDLQAQDYEFYKSMQWLKNNPIDQNMFTFSYIYDNFGNKIEKQLIPGGKQIVVNQQNKIQYIEKYCLAKMRDDFSKQISFFLQGFHQIVPQQCISYFEAKELQLLISGVPTVQIDDLKKNVDYSGYTPGDQIIIWFWEVVEGYTQENLAKLVQFITGTSKIPVEGFSQLVGMNGIQRISIHRDPCQHQLPKSHTCFNQLDLPNYASKEILKQKLDICLAWGSEGFGFM